MQKLYVWAEHIEGFVLAGTLSFEANGDERFRYDSSYLERNDAQPLYAVFPLQEDGFGTQETRAAFSSLGPEGPVGHDIRVALRAGRDAISPVLARLNHETVGALTFTDTPETPKPEGLQLMPLDTDFFAAFSERPEQTAFETLMESHLSLNGSVSKVGAIEHDGSFYKPLGLMPSTHILKAGSSAFKNQMLNEALCMRCAKACGFDDAAETNLLALEGHDPILVLRRFDRQRLDARPCGLPSVMRLHQSDFYQALGVSVDGLKYTPADALVSDYTKSIAAVISRESSTRYGDRSYFFDMQVFNYLIGNCDNHLKNLSLTWTADWQQKSLSPIYDVTCTTLYPTLSRDMGLGIGQHRAIDTIEAEDFPAMAKQLGLNWKHAKNNVAELAETFITTLMDAAHELESEYGVAAVELASIIAGDSRRRIEVALCAVCLND